MKRAKIYYHVDNSNKLPFKLLKFENIASIQEILKIEENLPDSLRYSNKFPMFFQNEKAKDVLMVKISSENVINFFIGTRYTEKTFNRLISNLKIAGNHFANTIREANKIRCIQI